MERIIYSDPPLKNQDADRVLRTSRSTTEIFNIRFKAFPNDIDRRSSVILLTSSNTALGISLSKSS